MSLSVPAAQPLLQQLDDTLKSVREACQPHRTFEYPYAAGEIPALGSKLRKFLPNSKREEPAVFWKCIIALNKARPGLKLISTLKILFARVSVCFAPGPLTKLVKLRDSQSSPLSPTEKVLVSEIDDCLEINRTPQNLVASLQLLLKICSTDFMSALKKCFDSSAYTKDERQFISHAAFLDVRCQYLAWNRYQYPAVVAAFDLANVLDYQPFLDALEPFLIGEFPTLKFLQKDRKRCNALQRQKKHRAREPE